MDIHRILKQYWGYDEFRPLQEDIIRSVLSGRDTLALMPTGGGKSITYQVPGMVLEGICMVVTPLIALMKDQVEELKKRGIEAEAVYTGRQAEEVKSVLNKALADRIKFLYVSPERLVSERFREYLKRMHLSLLAVDEAHCISQWGYDFRPSYLRIAEIRSLFPQVAVLALTATATPQVAEDIQRQLKFAEPHVLSKSFRRENISYVVRKANDKLGELLHILASVQGGAIVYVRKRATAEELADFLGKKGIHADYYHAGLSSLQRSVKQEVWKRGETPVIVATNAFGMGIDKPDVRLVVHFDIPDSPEAYFQEAGRAGRDGKRAYAVLLYNEATLTALKKRVDKNFPDVKFIREVYRLLGNFFQLEEGAGGGFAFEFNPDLFVKTYKLEYVQTLAAIGVLQVAGYLECTTEVHSCSRISFLVLRDQLYKVDLQTSLNEGLVELLLRTYSGIFVQYAFIEEEWIAERLGVTREDIYQALLGLARRKIVSYIPGNDRPYIVYHQPRVPESYLHIGREAYADRKLSYAAKVEKMIGYIQEDEKCRQLYLMDYFGQKETIPCGVCDYCLEQKKAVGRVDRRQVYRMILTYLQESDKEINALVHLIPVKREYVLEGIRVLLEDGKIVYKTPTVLALKR